MKRAKEVPSMVARERGQSEGSVPTVQFTSDIAIHLVNRRIYTFKNVDAIVHLGFYEEEEKGRSPDRQSGEFHQHSHVFPDVSPAVPSAPAAHHDAHNNENETYMHKG